MVGDDQQRRRRLARGASLNSRSSQKPNQWSDGNLLHRDTKGIDRRAPSPARISVRLDGSWRGGYAGTLIGGIRADRRRFLLRCPAQFGRAARASAGGCARKSPPRRATLRASSPGHLLVPELKAEALFQQRLQLHAAKAVEVEVFGQARIIVGGRGCFSGYAWRSSAAAHRCEHSQDARAVAAICSHAHSADNAAQQLARGSVREAWLRPAQHAANLLEFGERAVGLLQD